MYAIAALAELCSACLLLSAIAWLRHLYGAPPLMHDFTVRYIMSVLIFMAAVSSIWYAVDAQRSGEFHPESDPTAAVLALGCGVVLVGVLVWLVVEVRRFRARHGGMHPFS
jgi:type VI protein secretion system component VasK